MSDKKKLVGIYKDNNGEIVGVVKLKYLFPNEINELVNEQVLHEQKQKETIANLENENKALVERIAKIENEIKVLKGEDE